MHMEKKYILAIETSTEHLGIAVTDMAGNMLAEHNELAFRHLSDNTHPAIDNVMKEAGITYPELAFIATTRGPGSFTSVRIGLTAARGLAFALKIPVVGLTSLECLAAPHLKEAQTTHTWVEAHGGNVYVQTFHGFTALANPVSIPATQAAEDVKMGDVILGNGAIKHRVHLSEGVNILEDHAYINPVTLANIALKRFNDQTTDVNNTAPLYVHPLNYDKTYNKDGTKK